MTADARIALTTLLLLANSCAGPRDVEVRAVGSALGKAQPQAGRMAEAKGHFALGNVALALEQYRIAARENPQSIDALSGMAASYKALGRPELAQRQLELALAISPNDPALLIALAETLEVQGLAAKAALVRSEIPTTPVQPLASSGMTRDLPSIRDADTRPAKAEPVAIAAPPFTKLTVVGETPAPSAVVTPRHLGVAARPVEAIAPATGKAAQKLTVKLPPAAPMRGASPVGDVVGRSVTVALAPVRRSAQMTQPMPPTPRKLRLERLTLGEVALTTTTAVRWQPVPVQAPRAQQARLGPIQTPALRILNAARVQGLAGSARAMLLRRGWRAMEVGDAQKVHAVSLLYAPRHRVQTAARLAAQFSFPVRVVPSRRDFVLVLGTNANQKRARA